MQNIFQETVAKVYNGSKFYINFENRVLKVDNKYIIKDGVYDGELGIKPTSKEKMFRTIEKFYLKYRYSRPSERSDCKGRRYFLAVPCRELSDEALMFGIPRELAQVRLELYILCSILNGTFTWEDSRHFWTPEDRHLPELIILSKWVKGSVAHNPQGDRI